MKKERGVREFSKRLKRFLRKRGLKLLEVRAVLICEKDGEIRSYALLFKVTKTAFEAVRDKEINKPPR